MQQPENSSTKFTLKPNVEASQKKVTMSSRISKKETNPARDVLRVLQDQNAFYFYSKIDLSLGIRANSLPEFSTKLREVGGASIKFHVERHDFENWSSF